MGILAAKYGIKLYYGDMLLTYWGKVDELKTKLSIHGIAKINPRIILHFPRVSDINVQQRHKTMRKSLFKGLGEIHKNSA